MNLSAGPVRVPPPLNADAYTVASDCLVSEQARKASVYNMTNRYSPQKVWPNVAKDSRMVFWGLSQYIRRTLTDRVTHADIDESVSFMSQANSMGGPLPFNPHIWRRVVDEFGGYLPIKIQAPPEGSVFFPFEPVIQVTGVDGFGEIAAHIEAVLVGTVSISTARATLTRHLLERMVDWVKRDTPDVIDSYAVAQWMIHDFGMRASSNAHESEDLGLAHLLCFNGTDTFNAAYVAWKLGSNAGTGTSILALAHRIVQGYKSEQECFDNLHAQGQMGSYVADCYNFKRAVREKLTKLTGGPIVVARPDSGEYLENDALVRRTAVEHGEYEIRADGVMIPKTLKIIQGDSMTPEKTELLFRDRANNGFSPIAWGIIGMGGYLRNQCTRDTLSSAYKLSAVNDGDRWRPVVKLSETPGKLSVPGPNEIYRYKDGDSYTNHETVFTEGEYNSLGTKFYKTWYDCGKFADDEPFCDKQTRTIEDFNAAANLPGNFGGRALLSSKIRDIQDRFYREHQS